MTTVFDARKKVNNEMPFLAVTHKRSVKGKILNV